MTVQSLRVAHHMWVGGSQKLRGRAFYSVFDTVVFPRKHKNNEKEVSEEVDDDLTRDIKRQRENLDDLFYFHLESLGEVMQRQSKPVILTCNEKALKQLSTIVSVLFGIQDQFLVSETIDYFKY